LEVFLIGEGWGAHDLRKICLDRGIRVLGQVEPTRLAAHRTGLPVLGIEDAARHATGLIVIAHPRYADCERALLALGVPSSRILLFHKNVQQSLETLGPLTHFAIRRRGTVDEYLAHALQGKFADDTRQDRGPEDLRLAGTLCAMFRACQVELERADPLYRAGANWAAFLQHTRGDLYAAVAAGDAGAVHDLLANFWRNGLGDGIIAGEAACRTFCNTSQEILNNSIHLYLMALTQGTSTDVDPEDLNLPLTGNPFGLRLDGRLIHENSIMNQYRATFLDSLLADLEAPVVAEVGGGAGYLAHALLKRNPRVTYLDFDLPEALIVEAYLLARNFPDRRILFFDGTTEQLSREVLADWDIILMPTSMVARLEDDSVDLFVNTISFSEMSLPIVGNYLKQIDRTTRRYFYQENLAERNLDFENYPGDLFRIPESFKRLFSGPSRWPFFGPNSPRHVFTENIFVKRGQAL
jgi:hypothetical protein